MESWVLGMTLRKKVRNWWKTTYIMIKKDLLWIRRSLKERNWLSEYYFAFCYSLDLLKTWKKPLDYLDHWISERTVADRNNERLWSPDDKCMVPAIFFSPSVLVIETVKLGQGRYRRDDIHHFSRMLKDASTYIFSFKHVENTGSCHSSRCLFNFGKMLLNTWSCSTCRF